MMIERIKAKIRETLDIEKLKLEGLSVGNNLKAQKDVIIDPGHCWLIEIGNNVTMAPRVHILAHDASTKIPLGFTKIGRVHIGNNVFIGAGTIVLPNVYIGDNVIIGAGSLVSKNLPSNGVYCGNPCIKVSDYYSWVEKQNRRMKNSPKYDENYIIGNITKENKDKMKKELKERIGFIR